MSTLAVDTKHKMYMRYLTAWQMVQDCVEGEVAVKFRKERYLPHPNPGEAQSPNPKVSQMAARRYATYLTRARFLNATGRTLNGMLGVAFGKPVTINLSGALAPLQFNADGKGQKMTQLMRDLLAEVLKSGRASLVSDFTGNGEQTLDTQGQPVLRFFTADQILNWRVSGDKTTLFVGTWTEDAETQDDDFQTYERQVWLELRMKDGVAHARRWSQMRTGTGVIGDQSTQTALVPLSDAAGNPLTELPMSWLGSINNDAWPDPAPLSDVASLNIGHYQADADVCESAHIAGQPTLILAGLTQAWVDKNLADGVQVGATKGIVLPTDASGAIIQANETNASTNLKEQRAKEMAMIGAKLLERGTAAKTATQAQFEAETDNSILSLCAGNVEQCINKALEFMAMMVNGAGEVEINKRYEIATVDSATLVALTAMVQNGTLSLHNFIRYQQSVGLVPDDLSPEEVEGELRDQAPLPGLDLMANEITTRTEVTPTEQQPPQENE